MKWLSIQEVAKRTGKSERTLRLFASQGKIVAKKDGKSWVCDTRSLINIGFVLNEEVASLPKSSAVAAKALPIAVSVVPNAASVAVLPQDSAKIENPKEVRKYKTLNDLGVQNDLLKIWFEIPLSGMEEVEKYLKFTMEQIALGFYEYQPERKAGFFRNARECLVKGIMGMKMHKLVENHKNHSLFIDRLENEILPGIIGLIRRAEKR